MENDRKRKSSRMRVLCDDLVLFRLRSKKLSPVCSEPAFLFVECNRSENQFQENLNTSNRTQDAKTEGKNYLASFCAQWTQKPGPKPIIYYVILRAASVANCLLYEQLFHHLAFQPFAWYGPWLKEEIWGFERLICFNSFEQNPFRTDSPWSDWSTNHAFDWLWEICFAVVKRCGWLFHLRQLLSWTFRITWEQA